jgi:MFS superfamily sulfate permease-like transporter
MSTNNAPSNSPAANKRRPAMIIAMIPLGAIVGFIGGLLIVIIVGSSPDLCSARNILEPTFGSCSASCPESAR